MANSKGRIVLDAPRLNILTGYARNHYRARERHYEQERAFAGVELYPNYRSAPGFANGAIKARRSAGWHGLIRW